MPGVWELLAVTHLNGVWPEIFFPLVQKKDLRWTFGSPESPGARIPTVEALNGEIFARATDRITIAPIIARGSQAPLKVPGPTVRLTQSTVPKIKHGIHLDEDFLQNLARVEANLSGTPAVMSDDLKMFLDYETDQMGKLGWGVAARLEHMAVGMLLDTYTYTSEKGVQFSMSWGAPSDTKVTPSVAWGDGTAGISHGAASATPISDIQLFLTNMSTNYGKVFNRMTISRQAFDYILNTNEFKAMAPLFFSQAGLAPTFTAIPFSNRGLMQKLFAAILGGYGEAGGAMEIEFDDRTVMIENMDLQNWTAPPATPASGQLIRYQPVNKVIFTNSADDGDRNMWNIANLKVLESLPGMVPGMIGANGSNGNYGPFSYASATSLTGDPPGKVLFAVQEALPRKVDLIVSGVFTVF